MALLMVLSLVLSAQAMSFESDRAKANRYVQEVKADLMAGRLAERTDFALDGMIRVAVQRLKNDGFEFEGQKIKKEWEEQWKGYIVRTRDLGDHAPLSQWLADTYKKIEALLGKEVCEWLHLDDINVMNYAIPVVFHPCDIEWDKAEYQRHFVPFCGVLAYWGTLVPCLLFSAGTMVFFCSPIASLAEHLMVTFIAPGISDKVYERFCGNVFLMPYQYPEVDFGVVQCQ